MIFQCALIIKRCSFTTNITPNMDRNGKKLKAGKTTSITHVGEETTLEVHESRVEKDAGEYKCVAVNQNGKATHQAQVDIDADVV